MTNRLFRTTPTQIDAALLVLRVVVGVIFIAHGGQKLFVYGLAGVQSGFGQMGIPAAALAGPLVAFVEFFGGIALVVGALTRLFGIALAVTMLGAMLLVHLPEGFFAPQGIEFPLALMGGALALAVAGAGSWSVDGALANRTASA